jgi:murein DD-endopeptidase MepM/ murein hydrolase activator NlpD
MEEFMAKKFFSVIIVPHSKTNFKTLTFSKKAMKILIGGAAAGLLVLLFILTDYFSMSYIRAKYKKLSHESAEQKEKIANYEISIQQLKTAIASYENYAKKLNIMMGFKSADVIKGEPGIGSGGPGPGESEEPAPDPQSISLGAIQNLTRKAESVEKNLGSLVSIVESQAAKLSTTPSIWPAQGWVSSPMGYRIDSFTGKMAFHRGLDIATNPGNPVVATADGTVLEANFDKFFGNTVVLSHGNGLVTQYGHMIRSIVKPGQKVKRGDQIGFVGKTGKASGPHLHYEVRINGKAVNPYNYILEE